jgi:hypothetical protein
MALELNDKVVEEVRNLAFRFFRDASYQKSLSLFRLISLLTSDHQALQPLIEICESRLLRNDLSPFLKKDVDIELLFWLSNDVNLREVNAQIIEHCAIPIGASLTLVKPRYNDSKDRKDAQFTKVGERGICELESDSLHEALATRLCYHLENRAVSERLFITISDQYLQSPEQLLLLVAKHISDERIHCYQGESISVAGKSTLLANLAAGAIYSSRMFTDDFAIQHQATLQFSSARMPFIQAHALLNGFSVKAMQHSTITDKGLEEYIVMLNQWFDLQYGYNLTVLNP